MKAIIGSGLQARGSRTASRARLATRTSRGFTLIELVIAIVVVSICVMSVLGLLSALAVRSASATVQTQAASIATAYLNDILAQPFGASVAAYNNLDHLGARDRTGAALPALGQYRVQVAVTTPVLNPGATQVNSQRIDVTVTHPSGVRVALAGYRANYAWQVLR